MAKLRKGCCYKRPERPYTRKSKRREKSFVRGVPFSKIVSFDMGDKAKAQEYPCIIHFISKDTAQVRHNALEAARVAVNKVLTTDIGLNGYYFKIKTYPHHVLRENALAAGAGADRFSTGMAHSFGKPTGIAAQIKAGQEVMYITTTPKYAEIAKKAMHQARYKLSLRANIFVENREPKAKL
ncbi:MAG: 50S ribosomal protein L16 [Candidatus Nanoarchaeia archaeon]|nr:50S ribosomal protein L16 [Candidatus Nanoarchaeia archaeon]MDD5239700.1 50S ribosomal protein L16 [Candidatus Nanoarchaeia archaeon]